MKGLMRPNYAEFESFNVLKLMLETLEMTERLPTLFKHQKMT